MRTTRNFDKIPWDPLVHLQAMSRLLASLLLACAIRAQSPDPTESAARQVLEANCLSCHGTAKMANLDLRDRAHMLTGGTRGPALIPGNPAASLIAKAVRREGDLQMPPGKKSLPAADIAAIEKWIAAGAPWNSALKTKTEPSWWSFRKPTRPAIPAHNARTAIDNFIAAKLADKNLTPSPAADKRTLIRRATFDLHGLPPTPAEIEAFLTDTTPAAYEKLLDRLLASPRYGERWARHWLDVVRYADTGGYETDVSYANAWRYRDYVINALNSDKPYTEFVREQIAADELFPTDYEREGGYFIPPAKQALIQKHIATGLYTIGPMSYENALHVEQYRAEWQADAVETTASAFLGLTFGCARCHDHKFDPISQRDYYKMAAMFAGSVDRETPIVGQYGLFEYTRFVPRLQQADQIKAQLQRMAKSQKGPLTPEQKDLRETLIRKLGEAYLESPNKYAAANILAHTEIVPDTHLLARGDFSSKGEKVQPGYPSALHDGPEISEPPQGPFVPQRRKALAEWMTSPDNPLLSRVLVNRIWQGHFDRGLVSTANDFGRQGELPSHPELLDWLAAEFAERNHSMKALHKLIMLTDAYRRSSAWNESNARKDAENVYLWRMNRRRLEAEEIRDAVLTASGSIVHKIGGPPVVLPLSCEELEGIRDPDYWPVSLDPQEQNRRGVYLYVKRSFRMPMFENFDAPDPAQSCARREASVVAPQALAMMNSAFAQQQAKALADQLRKKLPAQRVQQAFQVTIGREPTAAESAKAREFLATQRLENFCLLLFNLNEFLYVD